MPEQSKVWFQLIFHFFCLIPLPTTSCYSWDTLSPSLLHPKVFVLGKSHSDIGSQVKCHLFNAAFSAPTQLAVVTSVYLYHFDVSLYISSHCNFWFMAVNLSRLWTLQGQGQCLYFVTPGPSAQGGRTHGILVLLPLPE